MIATALVLIALSSPYPSPAKAGAQLRALRSWAPAFAGEGAESGRSGRSVAVQPGGMSPLDAERAFAADAQTLGQWTAFRKWAARDATMFVPQPINAQSWLKDRKDPAKAIAWWPTASYVSCDGSLAVNTGGWKRPDGAVGYFSTVWQRQRDGGWKWIVDGGDELKVARGISKAPKTIKSSCGRHWMVDTSQLSSVPGHGAGQSVDGTLSWHWRVAGDGSRRFGAEQLRRSGTVTVIDDKIAAPK